MSSTHSLIRHQLAQQVRLLRLQRAWSQETLADISGLHRACISAVEQGERNITLDTLVSIAQALDVSPSRLLSTQAIYPADALSDQSSIEEPQSHYVLRQPAYVH